MAYQEAEDQEFLDYIQKKKEEEERKEYARANSGSFESIKYVAPAKDSPIIIRLLGSPLHKSPTDPKELQVSKIKDDSGKWMYLYFPTKEQDSEYFLWRVINAVRAPKYDNGKKFYPNETEHPDIWNKVMKNGYSIKDAEYKFASGWAGSDVMLYNCIDRLDDWCKENKHTKVLSRNISTSVTDDGKVIEYPDIGIKAYGFLQTLQRVLTITPNYEKFDLFLNRTGDQTHPYEMFNASRQKQAKFFEEFGPLQNQIDKVSVDEKLSDSEKEYVRYDFDKLFKTTSYNKILTRLGKTIKAIDAALGRNFYDELKTLADTEAKENKIESEAKKEIEEHQKQNIASEEVAKVEEKVETRATRPISSNTEKAAPENEKDFSKLLGGWNLLTEEERSKIKNVEVTSDGIHIEYVCNGEKIYSCPSGDCQCESPESFHHCPACGYDFG